MRINVPPLGMAFFLRQRSLIQEELGRYALWQQRSAEKYF